MTVAPVDLKLNLPVEIGASYSAVYKQSLRLGTSRRRRTYFERKVATSTPVDVPTEAVALEDRFEQPRPRVRIGGESFYVEVDDSTVYLRHSRWSLVGAGATLAEAERDLRAEARELAEVMADMPRASFDVEALKLFQFVLRVG